MRKNVEIGIVFMVTVAFNPICAYAQDLITTKDGDTIQAKILEVDKDEIKYKKYGYLDGPTFVVPNKNVLTVQYADGTSETYNKQKKKITVKYQGEVTAGFGYGPDMRMKLFKDEAFTEKRTLSSNTMRSIVSTVHGVRLSRYVFIGAGLDFQYSDSGLYSKMTLLPVFGNIKGYLPLGKRFDLYATISLGANISLCTYDDEDGYSFEAASAFGLDSSTYFLQYVKVKGKIFEEYGLGFRYRKLNFSMGFSQQVLDLHPTMSDITKRDRYGAIIFKDSDAGDSVYAKVRINTFFFKVGVMF